MINFDSVYDSFSRKMAFRISTLAEKIVKEKVHFHKFCWQKKDFFKRK